MEFLVKFEFDITYWAWKRGEAGGGGWGGEGMRTRIPATRSSPKYHQQEVSIAMPTCRNLRSCDLIWNP